MNRKILLVLMAAVVIGATAGLLWVHAARGPAPAPVTSLEGSFAVSPVVVPAGGTVGVTGTASIVGGPSPAAVDLTATDERGDKLSMRVHTILKRNGTASINVPVMPIGGTTGSGTLTVTVRAGGKTASHSAALAVTGGDFDVDVSAAPRAWTYENDGTKTAGRHKITLTAAITNEDEWTVSYAFQWKAMVNLRTGKALKLVGGGDANTATFAAPEKPAGSGGSYLVLCEVVGRDDWEWTTGEAVGAAVVKVRLLGDADGDRDVDASDYDVWEAQNGQTGSGLTADFNGDGKVDADDSALWNENKGRTCAP